MPYLQPYLSPLGPMTMASDGRCLTGLWFDGQKYFPDLTAGAYEWRDLPLFGDVRLWLADYFSGCQHMSFCCFLKIFQGEVLTEIKRF